MEGWQKKGIQKRRKKLIENTNVTISMLNYFISKELITDEEKKNCLQLQLQLGPLWAADKLYDILLTRVGAFGALQKTLQKEKQTGAYKILRSIRQPR